MVALTLPAPTRPLSRKQRRREERLARRIAAPASIAPLCSTSGASETPSGTAFQPAAPPCPASRASNASSVGGASSPPTIDELIEDYLTLDLPLTALARRHRLSLGALCDLIESETFQAIRARLNAIAAQRAGDIALQARSAALEALARIRDCPDSKPETARKAAGAILRASDPAPSRRAARQSPDGPDTVAAPPAPAEVNAMNIAAAAADVPPDAQSELLAFNPSSDATRPRGDHALPVDEAGSPSSSSAAPDNSTPSCAPSALQSPRLDSSSSQRA